MSPPAGRTGGPHAPRLRQRSYYAATASQYDDAHVTPGDEHYIALEYVAALMRLVGATSVLDVGSGTGRALEFLGERLALERLEGVEPVAELRAEAHRKGVAVIDGDAEHLPFADDSFDAVVATGVMHHLARPHAAIGEMTRVAGRAVFISDDNRFGHGSRLARRVKLLVHSAGLWPLFEVVRTHGRGYMESESDGVFYSFSVYDALGTLAVWGDRTFVIPTGPSTDPSRDPRLASSHGLLVGLREPDGGWAGRPDRSGQRFV
jgi:SAM-dependent methyltransferase